MPKLIPGKNNYCNVQFPVTRYLVRLAASRFGAGRMILTLRCIIGSMHDRADWAAAVAEKKSNWHWCMRHAIAAVPARCAPARQWMRTLLPPCLHCIGSSLIFQKTVRYLWRFYSLLFRGFFVAFPWLFRGPHLLRKTVFWAFFVAFSWFFRCFFVALILGKFYAYSPWKSLLNLLLLLKFRRVTIRGAQPSARLSEEIYLSEGSAGVSQRALRGLCGVSPRVLRGSAGVRGIFRGVSGVVTLCL